MVSHISSFNILSCFIYADLISSLLDPKLVDPRSTLVHLTRSKLKLGHSISITLQYD